MTVVQFICLCTIWCLFSCDVLCSRTCGVEDDSYAADKVGVIVFNGNDKNFTTTNIRSIDAEGYRNVLNGNKSSIVYIHGFIQSSQTTSSKTIIKAYLKRGDINVISVDWSEIAVRIDYLFVARQVPAVARIVALTLEKISDVIDLSKLHLIGHSIGAHIGAQIARNLNVTIPRITGLDPAYPLFYPSTCHISASDAKIVVALHTDPGVFGTPVNTGSVDFYANKGKIFQPGCNLLHSPQMCSHDRAIVLFVEAVNHPKEFPSRKCSDFIQDDGVVYFGDHTPEDLSGEYCFTTNSMYPYGNEDYSTSSSECNENKVSRS